MSFKTIKLNLNKNNNTRDKTKHNSQSICAKALLIKQKRKKINTNKKFSSNRWGNDNSNYVFIDFKMANASATSVYQIAIIKVVAGKIIKFYHSLVKPIINNFTFNCFLSEQLKVSLDFKALWPEIKLFFTDETILIANFVTINTFKTLINYYNLQCSNFYYFCWKQLFSKIYSYDNNTIISIAHQNSVRLSKQDLLGSIIILQKLITLHFSKNYHFKILCANFQIKIYKLFTEKQLRLWQGNKIIMKYLTTFSKENYK